MKDKIIKEAAQIKKDHLQLKFYEALEKAKEKYKKEPIAGKQNRSLRNNFK